MKISVAVEKDLYKGGKIGLKADVGDNEAHFQYRVDYAILVAKQFIV